MTNQKTVNMSFKNLVGYAFCPNANYVQEFSTKAFLLSYDKHDIEFFKTVVFYFVRSLSL
jgi:hypothetical protein